MMKYLVAILAFVMLGNAQAQTNDGEEAVVIQGRGTARKVVTYDEGSNEVRGTGSAAASTSPIYILNNQKYQGYQGGTTTNQANGQRSDQSSAQISEQPTTVIQDTAISGGADAIRKKRVEAEAGTEDGIVQALEKARMDDEMKRRDRFNDAIGGQGQAQSQTQTQSQGQSQQQIVQPVQVIPVIIPAQPAQAPAAAQGQAQSQTQTQSQSQAQGQVVTPVLPVEEVEEKPHRHPPVRNEVRTEIVVEKDHDHHDHRPFYVSGLLGMGKYPDVVNIQGNMSGGVAVGMRTSDRISIEGTFVYGNYDLEDLYLQSFIPRIVEMRQYNLGVGAKYAILPGKVRPNVGALLAYTRRGYREGGYEFKTTNAVDAGLSAGLDVVLSEALSIGIDFRYLTNVSTQRSGNGSFVYTSRYNEIEKLDYYMTSLSAQLSF